MDRAAPDPASGPPLPKDEEILWLPAPRAEVRDKWEGQVYGPCSIVPVRREGPPDLVIEDDIGNDFSRRIMPAQGRTPRGDPLVSLMTGAMSMVIAVVNLSALLGLAPESIPGLAKKATIIVGSPTYGYGAFKTTPGWWFVPDGGFFVLATSALVLSSIGILLSRRRGTPVTGLVAFGLNTLVLLAGFVLALTDFQQW
jgi:hypothetical protein